MKKNTTIKLQTKRKAITALCIAASFAAFATLGDGGNKNGIKTQQRSLLSVKSYPYNFKTFSLKSGSSYRGNHIFTTQDKYILLNTTITYQKGNTTYILPLKKKVLLDRIKFNPAH